ncbi:MAG TPA: M10 family metallopeptidase, partial [Bauldia sp.]|nr:M10 family metallopeptidase [Bauldia sp.]
TLNSVPTTSFLPIPGDAGALQSGVKWGGLYGTGVVLTYSFPSGTASFIDPYGDGEFDSWYPLTSTERVAVQTALVQWGSAANIAFVEVADNSEVVGDLRFVVTDNAYDETAHAYLPGDYPEAGDVWFLNGEWHKRPNSDVKQGSWDYLVILHEVGHAIGLEHSFEQPQRISQAYDSFAYTVMSYSATPGGNSVASFYPTTPMYYDLVNIQGMYGRGVHNPGDTVYTYKDGKAYWETIDDSGGIDTIVRKGSDKGLIDLNIHHWSDLGRSIEFSHSSTRWTVMIGPETLIENATGGAGKDKIIGNALANVLAGREGKDDLLGGAGPDSFLFDVKLKAANVDTIRDFTPGADLLWLSHAVFDAIGPGLMSAADFAGQFDYANGLLKYHGKPVVRLAGAPAIDEGDLVIV